MSALPIAMYRRVGRLSSCALLIVLSMGVGDVAFAQGGDGDQAIERAVVLFETAEERYREGRFDVAVQLLLEARALHDDPTISYNLGRAYEELEKPNEAIAAYRHYLDGAPNARDRGAVEARITRLEDARVERERREAVAREAVERAARERRGGGAGGNDGDGVNGNGVNGDGVDGGVGGGPSGSIVPPVLVLSAGVVGVGVGAIFGVLSDDAHARAVDDPIHQTARAAFRDAETFATAANVAFVIGGIVAAAGLTWLVIELASSDAENDGATAFAPISVVVGPGTLVLRGDLP